MENYQNFIASELETIKQEKGYEFNIIVSSEQAYAKVRTFASNTVYVVIKMLASTLTYNIITQPVQIMVLTEQNRIDQTKELMEEFVARNNWKDTLENTKQQYASPVVLSNFNEIGYGYRTLIYINGTLQIMEEIVDVQEFKIDNVLYQPTGIGIAYVMSGNTQALSNTNIAVTEKSVSTLSLTFSMPLLNNALTEKVLKVLNETTSGNVGFLVNCKFQLGEVPIEINTTMKMINANIETAPNQAPSLRVGLMR